MCIRDSAQAAERAEKRTGLVHDRVVVGVAAAEGAAVGRRRRRGVTRGVHRARALGKRARGERRRRERAVVGGARKKREG